MNDSTAAPNVTPRAKHARTPPPPPERIILDMAQVMRWRHMNPPWSYRQIARKLGNVGYITVRKNVLAYEAAEKAAAKAIADREQTKSDAKARQAVAEAAKPKDSPRTAYVPDWIPPTQPLINSPQAPTMPTPKPVPVKTPAPPVVPAAAPDVLMEQGIGDFDPGFGYGTGYGVRWTAPEPPTREAAGGLVGMDDGTNEGK